MRENEPRYLTPKQVASMLQICREKLYALTEPRGPIKAVRLGSRCIRYPADELEAWLAEQRKSKK